MTWQKKHDIILSWVDSCKTFQQLTNMVHYIKQQDFPVDDLLGFCRIKGHAVAADMIIENMGETIKRLSL